MKRATTRNGSDDRGEVGSRPPPTDTSRASQTNSRLVARRMARAWTALAVVVLAVGALVSAAPVASATTAVTNVTVSVSPPSSAAGALTTYNVGFKTSASGALSGNAGATITVTLPAGSGLNSLASGSINVGANSVGACYNGGGTTVSCYVYAGSSVHASTTASLALPGVTNPSAGSYTLQVSTSADTAQVSSLSYTITAAMGVSNATVAVSSPSSAARALTTYQVGFTTSSTGGLDGNAGSTITITLPAGTGLNSFSGGPIDVGANTVGYCNPAGGTTVVCYVYGGDTVAASTAVAIPLYGVTNPSAGSYSASIATSSDTNVASVSYTITPARGVSNATVTVSSPSSAAGALTTYQVGFTTSSTGGLDGYTPSTINVTWPAGSGLNTTTGIVNAGGNTVGYCNSSSSTSTTCPIYGGSAVPANAVVSVALQGVVNPSAGSYTLAVSTTSDTNPVSTPSYTITAAKSVTSASLTTSSSVPGASNVTYKLKVKSSSTGGLDGNAGSQMTIALPAGTGLNNFSGGNLNVGVNSVGQCYRNNGTVITCYVYGGVTVAASATMSVTLTGVKNPTTAQVYTASVSTTSDTIPKTSTGYCVVAAGVPCIATVATASGAYGSTVTITGANLAGATAVAFHGSAAAILTDTAAKLTTSVPMGATSGTITVTTAGGTATSPSVFKVIPPPTITSFSPTSAPVGTLVTINGRNLSKATAVTFNGTTAVIHSDTSSQITATVPAGATTGPIAVTTAGGNGSSASNFTVS